MDAQTLAFMVTAKKLLSLLWYEPFSQEIFEQDIIVTRPLCWLRRCYLHSKQLFAQLYAHMDIEAEPSAGGCSMVAHFGTRLLDAEGRWRSQVDNFNSSADISPTSGQMPRLVGIALDAAARLQELSISVEVIDVQSLFPFDIHHSILESVKKTRRVLFVDEDMLGGASAFMMQQVLQIQGGYEWLDSEPRALSAPLHRPATGPDGDYFCKPNAEQIIETIY